MCKHRVNGKTCGKYTYYACTPNKDYLLEGHPKSFWLREEKLLEVLTKFFNVYVFGANRRVHLTRALRESFECSAREYHIQMEAVQRVIAEIEDRQNNLVRSLELSGEAGQVAIGEISDLSRELRNLWSRKDDLLAEVEAPELAQTAPELLEMLPFGEVDLADLAEPTLRRLFEVLQLEIHYDWRTNVAECKVTLTDVAIQAQREVTRRILHRAVKLDATSPEPPPPPPFGLRPPGNQHRAGVLADQILISHGFVIDVTHKAQNRTIK
ncbi:hypothetical protein [Actinomadura rupiterrae]|uniref:hypothetical protein n=1 Tax=Actinomadura rupiterrae TaxID=559627 RepID=UPI0020A3DBD7|nr:hypothetical protein [Actinomadura rupiterrae]MCP2337339.1 hypothetical protein [Actinomadura rupiterrae]